jgi:hypothetical protein
MTQLSLRRSNGLRRILGGSETNRRSVRGLHPGPAVITARHRMPGHVTVPDRGANSSICSASSYGNDAKQRKAPCNAAKTIGLKMSARYGVRPDGHRSVEVVPFTSYFFGLLFAASGEHGGTSPAAAPAPAPARPSAVDADEEPGGLACSSVSKSTGQGPGSSSVPAFMQP